MKIILLLVALLGVCHAQTEIAGNCPYNEVSAPFRNYSRNAQEILLFEVEREGRCEIFYLEPETVNYALPSGSKLAACETMLNNVIPPIQQPFSSERSVEMYFFPEDHDVYQQAGFQFFFEYDSDIGPLADTTLVYSFEDVPELRCFVVDGHEICDIGLAPVGTVLFIENAFPVSRNIEFIFNAGSELVVAHDHLGNTLVAFIGPQLLSATEVVNLLREHPRPETAGWTFSVVTLTEQIVFPSRNPFLANADTAPGTLIYGFPLPTGGKMNFQYIEGCRIERNDENYNLLNLFLDRLSGQR